MDDPTFNPTYHVHALRPRPPAPRSSSEHRRARLLAGARSLKPLWEMWLVQGLEGSRFAIINKTHHALVDGVAGWRR